MPMTRSSRRISWNSRQRGVLAAGVPVELGGGGASYPELCEMLRVLARSLRFDRAHAVHAHASPGDTGLALAA